MSKCVAPTALGFVVDIFPGLRPGLRSVAPSALKSSSQSIVGETGTAGKEKVWNFSTEGAAERSPPRQGWEMEESGF